MAKNKQSAADTVLDPEAKRAVLSSVPGFGEAEELLDLAHDKSTAGRTRLVEIISELFEGRGETLSDRERNLIFGIIHRIIHDVELAVRQSLSEVLSNTDDAPPELIRELANDKIEVAYPILSRSKVLQDEDLIQVIRMRSLEHQLAITVRPNVSETVSGVLVEKGHERVIESLLKNQNARISKATMDYLVEQSKRVDTYREPILDRHDLKPEIAERMFSWVSSVLRHHIIDKFQMPPEKVNALIRQAAVYANRDAGHEHGAQKLASALNMEGLVSQDLLVDALRDGELPLFLSLFSMLTGAPEIACTEALFMENGELLAAFCKASDIDIEHFREIFSLSRKSRPSTARSLKTDAPRALHFFNKMRPLDAMDALEKIKTGRSSYAVHKYLMERVSGHG